MQRSAPELFRLSSSWPDGLRAAVAAAGADKVWTVGLHHLGYPPTWALDGSEYAFRSMVHNG